MLVAGPDDVIDDDVIAPTAAVVDATHAQVGSGDDGEAPAAAGKARAAAAGGECVGGRGQIVASQCIAEVGGVSVVLAGQSDVATGSR